MSVGASKEALFVTALSYFTTAKISFTSILYPQFTHMILIIYTLHHKCLSCLNFTAHGNVFEFLENTFGAVLIILLIAR